MKLYEWIQQNRPMIDRTIRSVVGFCIHITDEDREAWTESLDLLCAAALTDGVTDL